MFLHSLATATPPHSFTQAECLGLVRNSPALQRDLNRRSRLMLSSILRGDSGIARRQFASRDVGRLFALEADELNEEFRHSAPSLAAEALRPALQSAAVQPHEVDALVVCTCTGYLCPGVSSYVAESLGLRNDVWLQDLVGLGCGAAIPALRAVDGILASQPAATVACIAVEVCSAAFYLDNDPVSSSVRVCLEMAPRPASGARNQAQQACDATRLTPIMIRSIATASASSNVAANCGTCSTHPCLVWQPAPCATSIVAPPPAMRDRSPVSSVTRAARTSWLPWRLNCPAITFRFRGKSYVATAT